MTDVTTLREIVERLEPPLLRTLSSLHVTWTPDGPLVALSFCLYRQPSPSGSAPHHAITVDTDNLPTGVGYTGWERWPDLVRPLASEPDIETQIRSLDASGVVGRLDASRFDRGPDSVRLGHAPVSWVVKTHAGSEAERRAWMQALTTKGGS